MSPDSPPPSPRPPHPLALALIERLRAQPAARIVEIGSGDGRNTRALVAAGLEVVQLSGSSGAAAAITTHALLHGTPDSIADDLRAIRDALASGGVFTGTFGSARDARCGAGERLEPYVYAARDGDEKGVAHAYFNGERLRALLASDWEIESMEEVDVDTIAGTWAHRQAPLHNAVHWFVVATKR
jgi:hypothetical protein